MGELIRNLHPVHLGNEDLMVELNEGYKKSQGRVIHIQNKKFRYLLREKNYIRLAGTVLRAYEEMKCARAVLSASAAAASRQGADTAPAAALGEAPAAPVSPDIQAKAAGLAGALEDSGLDYRFLLVENSFLTVIVRPEDRSALDKCLRKKCGLKKLHHPWGKEFGYKFLYQMTPFALYSDGAYPVEVYFQLPCFSLTPKTFIPLDRIIQKRIWSEGRTVDGIKYLDLLSLYIYKLCYGILKRKCISASDRAFFDDNQEVLQDDAFRPCMEKVFFGFTDSLISCLAGGEYDRIVSAYYDNKDY